MPTPEINATVSEATKMPKFTHRDDNERRAAHAELSTLIKSLNTETPK